MIRKIMKALGFKSYTIGTSGECRHRAPRPQHPYQDEQDEDGEHIEYVNMPSMVGWGQSIVPTFRGTLWMWNNQ